MKALHKVRADILYMLRHQQTARFSELMKQSSLESDTFKFHVRALQEQGYIQKVPQGGYELTPIGKEAANNLDESGLHGLRQPKLSLHIVLSRISQEGETMYLVQQRQRQPFYGYWGCLSGPAQWGEDFEETARKELQKQCSITDVEYRPQSFYRQRDYDATGVLLEDKLFVIIVASTQSESTSEWLHGHNKWMTLTELSAQEKTFESSVKILTELDEQGTIKSPLLSGKTTYSREDY